MKSPSELARYVRCIARRRHDWEKVPGTRNMFMCKDCRESGWRV